jgi:gamma-polyglutamate biosynthesis protein CapC
MTEFLPASIGVGLAVSLLFSEFFGITAGGLVVPGYIALQLTHPLNLLLTLGAGLVTYALVHSFASVAIVYGRRRVVLMILVGYLIGVLFRRMAGVWEESQLEYQVVGFIIPGLIATWLDRQGIWETFGSLMVASIVVRLILMLALGTEFQP